MVYNLRVIKTRTWVVTVMAMIIWQVVQVTALNGPNVCMVEQKYNITKRVKYTAPMSVRTYVWCFSMPPRCSKWTKEIRELTRLETEVRTAEVAVCCPGYKMKDVSCIPICPHGKKGSGCSEDCSPNKWGPNCVNDCKPCSNHGSCSAITGECQCENGWKGESCDSMPTTTTTSSTTTVAELLKLTTKTAVFLTTPVIATTTFTPVVVASTPFATITSSITPHVTFASNVITSPLQTTNTQKKNVEDITPMTTPSVITKPTSINNKSLSTLVTTTVKETEHLNTTPVLKTDAMYNRTETSIQLTKTTESSIKAKTIPTVFMQPKPNITATTEIQIVSNTTEEATTKEVVSKRPDSTVRYFPSTVKFKPKEIWIRPAQKGEPSIESKIKTALEQLRHKSATNKEFTTSTSPKTIIVSIIPTSVTYTTHKKIAHSSSPNYQKNNYTVIKDYKNATGEVTRPMAPQTFTLSPNIRENGPTIIASTKSTKPIHIYNVTRPFSSTTSITSRIVKTSRTSYNGTNSMTSTSRAITTKTNSSNTLTSNVFSTNNVLHVAPKPDEVPIATKSITVSKFTNTANLSTTSSSVINKVITTKHVANSAGIKLSEVTATPERNSTATSSTTSNTSTQGAHTSLMAEKVSTGVRKLTPTNATKHSTYSVENSRAIKPKTEKLPEDEGTFHILTEPEHITAVMGEKGSERSSVDLISVISIAGGIMMAVITVAVVIVMVERCKRPRYENVRKINDIRMQVTIDNNDAPPPYVRSIFHTPLPEPPTSEKCHYQPISTLDRNLKQFMRPVVVQTISPIMLENFRGILECHYDHLPRRSHEFGPTISRCSVTPSVSESSELRSLRESFTESTIESLKREAKLDVIDNTTSEPLYAEIPCWRPPSEHAIEVINMNGEAVTEL